MGTIGLYDERVCLTGRTASRPSECDGIVDAREVTIITAVIGAGECLQRAVLRQHLVVKHGDESAR